MSGTAVPDEHEPVGVVRDGRFARERALKEVQAGEDIMGVYGVEKRWVGVVRRCQRVVGYCDGAMRRCGETCGKRCMVRLVFTGYGSD